MPDFSHADLNLGEVLFDNELLQDPTPVYSGTVSDGFSPTSALDWRDFSFFLANSASTTTLDFTMTADTDISVWSAFVGIYLGVGDHKIELFYEETPASYTLLDTIASTDQQVNWREFTEVTVLNGRNIRFTFTVGTFVLPIRQLVVGTKMVFDMGQWSGLNPPTLNQSVITTNTMAVNGSFLGRNRRRVEKKGRIELTHLTQTWIRDTWNLFSIEATIHAFIYRPNPVNYPDEVAWTIGDIMAPKNTRASLMSVDMPIKFITE